MCGASRSGRSEQFTKACQMVVRTRMFSFVLIGALVSVRTQTWEDATDNVRAEVRKTTGTQNLQGRQCFAACEEPESRFGGFDFTVRSHDKRIPLTAAVVWERTAQLCLTDKHKAVSAEAVASCITSESPDGSCSRKHASETPSSFAETFHESRLCLIVFMSVTVPAHVPQLFSYSFTLSSGQSCHHPSGLDVPAAQRRPDIPFLDAKWAL